MAKSEFQRVRRMAQFGYSQKVNINQEIDSNLKQDCHDAGLDPASDAQNHHINA
jgi:hypothetical protein